jgi:hypothetical protein
MTEEMERLSEAMPHVLANDPADEAVDCVAVLRLVQWKLVALPVEFVAAILQPVWPRDQHLTAA